MSKVSKNDLEKLIEGVLSEVINVNIGNINQELPTDPGEVPEDGLDKDKRDAWKALGVKSKFGNATASEPYVKLAQIDNKPNELSTPDVLKLFRDIRDGKDFDSAAVAAVKKMADAGSDEVKAMVKTQFNAALSASRGAVDTSQLSSAITSLIGDRDGQRVNPIGAQGLPARSLETSEKEFKEEEFKEGRMPKASPNLIALFGSIEGSSIQEKLTSISEFSQAAQNETLDQWSQDKDSFAAFTYAKVLNLLAGIKTTGSSEAGFDFERWLALLLNIPVAGAEQGAADNLGKIGEEIVYTSAKLYKYIYGENAPTQAKAKLLETTKGGKKMYYFIGQKIVGASGGGQAGKVQGYHFIEAIDLYMVEISQTKGKKLQGRFVRQKEGGGLQATQPYLLSTKVKDGQTVESQMVLTPQVPGDTNKFIFSKIYLPQGEITDNELENTAEYLTRQVNSIDDNVTQAIMNAAKSIVEMKADTESYAGKSVKKKKGASDYIDKIAKSHKSLVTLYNTIFQYGEGDKEDRTKKFDRSVTAESKITADYLRKLIEESFKK